MKKYLTCEEVENHPETALEEAREALQNCIEVTERDLRRYQGQFPPANSENGFYQPGPNIGWTTGFWTGEVWLSYMNTKNSQQKEFFHKEADHQVDSFLERIRNKVDVDHHDMGFLYIPSCVAAWKLTGNTKGREAALLAADQLMKRYRPEGSYLQAWGSMDDPKNHRLIIDCLLNVPLLYFASQETGEKRYRDVAEKHIHTTMQHIMRDDGSTWHTLYFDPNDGHFLHGATAQGYSNTTTWARGQAWGIYGTALSYGRTMNTEYVKAFRSITAYFLNHLPDDLCPFWDLSFGMGDEKREPRDSSASAIACCGLLAMSRLLPEEEGGRYRKIASRLLHSLIQFYQVTDSSVSDGQLLHGTYAKATPYNDCKNGGVDECVIWGDYFFMEALSQFLNPDQELFW
ncbi:MAG: glycoside hydrolase family 88 protein [Lachnospiraceae bacterium]|nr:glycoside hydrolase family 88 protein [Lachnospiraceae bacterium]